MSTQNCTTRRGLVRSEKNLVQISGVTFREHHGRCVHCPYQLSNTDKYCGGCGRKVWPKAIVAFNVLPEEQDQQDDVHCCTCGQEITSTDTVYCPNCGQLFILGFYESAPESADETI